MPNRVFQRFESADVEAAFQVHQATRAIKVIYWMMLGGASSIVIFAAMDISARGVNWTNLARTSFFFPMVGVALWIRHRPEPFLRHYHKTMFVMSFFGSLSALASFGFASTEQFMTMKSSIILTIFGLLALLRLRLDHALWIGVTTVFGYVGVCRYHSIPSADFTHDLSVLTVSVVLGSVTNWLLEREARDGFLLTHDLRGQVDEVESARLALSNEVEEHRTTLRQLDAARLEAENASQAKSDFLAAVSHELRTPMNGMAGSIQLLQSTELTAEQTQYHEVLSSSAQTLSLLLDDLFDLTRIEVGMMRIEPVPTDLHSMLHQIQATTERAVTADALELRYNWDRSTLPRWVLIDAKRTTQILANLIQNSLKFTHDGWVEIKAYSEGKWLTFKVVDTGKGLPDDASSVFRKYHQEFADEGGLGLGLSICQMLAEHMGGQISAHHRDSKGAEFIVKLPLLLANEPSIVQNVRTLQSVRTQDARVLLVEDNPINQKVARWTLEQLGCIVSVASDGQAALSQIETDEVDLIIMDCEMPGMNGYQVTERIRANETDRNSLPIIALTAHATRGARERCLDAGMNDYLAKPFRKADLQRVLERWLPG